MNSNFKWDSKPGNSSQGKGASGSKNGPLKSCGNTFGYSYPSFELQVLLLNRSCFPAVCMKKYVRVDWIKRTIWQNWVSI